INDKEYLAGQEIAHRLDEPGYVLLDQAHAEQFAAAGTLVVGAANAHWGTSMEIFTADGLMRHAKDNDLTGKVAIALGGHSLVTEEAIQANCLTLAEGQYLAVNEMDEQKGLKWHKGPLELTHRGETVKI